MVKHRRQPEYNRPHLFQTGSTLNPSAPKQEAVVAARLKRRFTGFDVDENYPRIASRRITDELEILAGSPRGV
ncbi:MAG TPA: hypothetical protein VGO96_02345 [Pyrinomonadaceae bacterium]|jgi:hypothetical protein|nr:hypothetical protein [Pyrinomonadaceae bacterium]